MTVDRPLKILFVSAEVSPFAKTGGLADVAGSLPKYLAAMGNDVRIAMPRYKEINNTMKYVIDFPVNMDWRKDTCIVRESELSADNSTEVPVYFIDNYHYFYRDGVYCFYDDGERFSFFCNAVVDMLQYIDFKPDIIHCNDWHTGPICMLLKEKYKDNPVYNRISTVFTIHNLQYQGHFSKELIKLFGVDESVFTSDKVEFYGSFNFMKAGIVYADIINAVSETYASEIQTEEFGEKLEGLLKQRKEDLFGIVNGIDYNEFNPETDRDIYKNYNISSINLKKQNKTALQKEFNLPVKDVPLLGLVSRLTGQKGLDLISGIAEELFKEDVQFILLGSGEEYYENIFRNLRQRFPDKMGTYIGFNASLAQRIYAGSDIFLMPSLFEPCGLGQIISMRYGTVPLVRATGGLVETVIDYDVDRDNSVGFVFKDYSKTELLDTLKRSFKVYKNTQEWDSMILRGMNKDFSWDKSSLRYVELYKHALNKKLEQV